MGVQEGACSEGRAGKAAAGEGCISEREGPAGPAPARRPRPQNLSRRGSFRRPTARLADRALAHHLRSLSAPADRQSHPHARLVFSLRPGYIV